jgi:DNA-binding NarL/FixJ family response regulator
MNPATLLLVEDQAVVATNLKAQLVHGYKVCGIAALSEEALTLARQHRPELALMDIRIQGEIDGIETTEGFGNYKITSFC